MVDPSVIRIFRFRAARRGFDDTLRTVLLPDLRAFPGVVEAMCGRQGPDEEGPRILVSLWSSMDAMIDSVSDRLGVFHPELMDHTTDQILEYHPILAARRRTDESPRVLRVLRGSVRPGELRAYVEDVEVGVEEDAARGCAPTTLYLAETGPDAFLTMTAWDSWADIERATGGDVHRPLATRKPERLRDWDVVYYEVIST